MGFITPTPPPFDLEEWRRKPHLERIKPLAQDWALNGFGTPTAVYLLYLVKIVIYALGGIVVIGASTPGLGGLGQFGDWWTQPIVFQKVVVLTMLWEVLGLGAGSMPLTFRFLPPIGGVLYWLRPGTIRLPPWPQRVPLTRGTRRTPLDVALYAGLLAAAGYLLLAGGSDRAPGFAGRLDTTAIAIALAFLAALGLRDKVPFLAARSELYGMLLVIFLFPLHDLIVGAQLTFVAIWLGAASSKLNRHFPFVVSVMISNTPWNRSRAAKQRLYTKHPDDLRPSTIGALSAHLGTVIEFTLPLTLLVTRGGTIGTIAVVGMIVFHTHIFSTFPLAVPLEWNVFMIFGLLFLFGHYGATPYSTLDDPLLIAIMASGLVGLPVLGNFRPDLISFLPAMRYYAGNWATSQWLFRRESGAEAKFDAAITKPGPIVIEQLTKLYGRELAELLLYKGLAFRAMHSHGRALNGLLPRAVDDIERYDAREGELIAGICCGYNFGDGHFHNEALLAAVQDRCHFEPGELRVIMLESQPAHVQRQHYRIHDAASGLLEEGWVNVADMVSRQPWLDDRPFPVHEMGSPPAAHRSTAPV
ncbi:MAG: DUF3556 domain-containing protein [Solirubrobacteraceae bacterium]